MYGCRGIAPRILNIGTRWEWVVKNTSTPFYAQERTLAPTGGWMGPTAGLDALQKRKISYPCSDTVPAPFNL